MYLIVFNFIGLPNKVATEGFFCHPNYVEMEHLCITITGKIIKLGSGSQLCS